jgi:hypothetical protein
VGREAYYYEDYKAVDPEMETDHNFINIFKGII